LRRRLGRKTGIVHLAEFRSNSLFVLLIREVALRTAFIRNGQL
jgi:hypothetical protein